MNLLKSGAKVPVTDRLPPDSLDWHKERGHLRFLRFGKWRTRKPSKWRLPETGSLSIV